jgi:hypothetical protein
MRCAFDPALNGFQFSNSNIQWSYGAISGTALCGGMIYVALDYYLGGMTVPKQQKVPVEGEFMHTLIFDRQWSAHNTIPDFIGYWMNDRQISNEQADFDYLKKSLSFNQPLPVCLFDGFGKGHHTLGIAAYGDSPFWIDLYDPNYPNKIARIKPRGEEYFHTLDNKTWRGFFIDYGYKWKQPPVWEGEFEWEMCYDCRLLYIPGSPIQCPKGGSHNRLGSATYVLSYETVTDPTRVLNYKPVNGINNWLKCKKCRVLYYAGNQASAGICPEGGIHNPQIDKNYTLAINGVGQPNWRRCIYCEGLFYLTGGGIGGFCPSSNGRHESDLTTIYTLPFATPIEGYGKE